MQESLETNKLQKLMNAIEVGDRCRWKEEVVLLKAFKEWKRLEYQFVLDGLKNYSATLDKRTNNDKNVGRVFPNIKN